MKKIILTTLVFSAGVLLMNSCKKVSGGEGNDEELITTLKVKITPAAGGSTQTFVFEDIDGPGGASPVIDNISLAAGTAYNVSLELWNNSATPPEDITTEVATEKEAHRFYFTPSGTNVTVSNLNNDDN